MKVTSSFYFYWPFLLSPFGKTAECTVTQSQTEPEFVASTATAEPVKNTTIFSKVFWLLLFVSQNIIFKLNKNIPIHSLLSLF